MEGLSITGKRWVIEDDFRRFPGDEKDYAASLLSHFRSHRGLDTKFALPFAEPGSEPFDMGKALERTQQAIVQNERVAIFGDFDCDGITSVCQLSRAFERRGLQPLLRLPQRVTEGYGLRLSQVEEFARAGVTLLFLLDTGIVAHTEIDAAAHAGMDVIILDHHRLPQKLPNAFAILHPSLAAHPGIALAAAGVVFGFVSALEAKEGTKEWNGREEDLALAAIGTVADLVKLQGENRELVQAGIAALERAQEGPIFELRRAAGIVGTLTSRDIGFRIAPRLNAAGRMDDPMIALKALRGDRESLLLLDHLNTLRQDSVRGILSRLGREPAGEETAFLCLASREYPAGVVGLVAGKLVETHGRPCLVAHIHGERCTASLRSIPGYDVTEAIRSCSDLLLTFGGHSAAAGCTFLLSEFPQLSARLNAHARERLTPERLCPILAIDGVLDPDRISLSLCAALSSLEPFGEGNKDPRFLLPGVQFSALKRVGRDFSHLQGMIHSFKLVGFGLGSFFERMPQIADVACRLSIDAWNGTQKAQLIVEDVRAASSVSLVESEKQVGAVKT